MAGFAVDLGDVIGMRILLDVGMAVVALEASVHAGAELVAINRNAVTGCVLHGLVAVACQAIRLRREPVRHCEQKQRHHAEQHGSAPSNAYQQSEEPLGGADDNGNQERNDSCGFGHAAVSSSMVREQLRLRTWLPRSGFLHLFGKH